MTGQQHIRLTAILASRVRYRTLTQHIMPHPLPLSPPSNPRPSYTQHKHTQPEPLLPPPHPPTHSIHPTPVTKSRHWHLPPLFVSYVPRILLCCCLRFICIWTAHKGPDLTKPSQSCYCNWMHSWILAAFLPREQSFMCVWCVCACVQSQGPTRTLGNQGRSTAVLYYF